MRGEGWGEGASQIAQSIDGPPPPGHLRFATQLRLPTSPHKSGEVSVGLHYISWQFARMADDLTLAAEFAPATREDWLKLVRAALKDRPIEKLTARTYDGLAIEPLHPRAP